uniref:GPI mannosyltransferase 2 n=1 Tax=Babesia bovis TaxID=5865 RepID=A7ARC5_BABBO|eukprot:XP_001610662.1 hypothetical protein [Babesia bovis T2Bo]
MKAKNNDIIRPRHLGKVLKLACLIKVVFCIFVTTISWHSRTKRPYVDQRQVELNVKNGPNPPVSTEASVKLSVLQENCSYKVHSEACYPDAMSLLDDRNPDGTINDHFYNGIHFKLWKWLIPYISWDAERFLKIAIDGVSYWSEDQLAFMPLLPFLMNVTGKALRYIHLRVVSIYAFSADTVEAPMALYMALAGFFISNIAAILSAGAMYLLVWEIIYRRKLAAMASEYVPKTMTDEETSGSMSIEYVEKISYISAFFFCLSPPTVHCTSIYTESLFCLCTFVGNLLLFYVEDWRKIATHSVDHNMSLSLRIYVVELLAVGLFFMASALRSNGFLLLLPLFFYTLRVCNILRRFNLIYSYNLKQLGCDGNTNFDSISVSAIIRFVVHWLRALCYALAILSPMVVFQIYLYCLHCVKLNAKQLEIISQYPSFVRMLISPRGFQFLKGLLASYKTNSRPWCTRFPPNAYAFVQKKYWDVGFLWIIREIDRLSVFTYSWPTYLVAYLALKWYYKFIATIYSTLSKKLTKLSFKLGSFFIF